jgi:hypothetical protein
MRPVSDEFLSTLSTSHKMAVEVRVVQTDDVLDGVVDGTVTLDGTAAIRGSIDLTIVDDGSLDLIPTTPNDLLAPYGNELQVSRGVEYADGSKEMVSLGIFRIETVEVNDQGSSTEIRLSGLDRAASVTDAKFDRPGQVAYETAISTAIEDIVTEGYPEAEFLFGEVPYTLPRVAWEEGADRWEFVQRLATMSGGELFFNGDGVLVLREVPKPEDGPVAAIAEGQNGVLLSASRRWTRENAYNRIIVTGESMNNGPPYRGEAYDDDDASPTYYGGTFGKVIHFERSDIVGSAAQAEAAAIGLLAKQRGTFSELSLGAVVLPHLEPGDVVSVTRDRLEIEESHVLDQLTIPLTVSAEMSANTRGVMI